MTFVLLLNVCGLFLSENIPELVNHPYHHSTFRYAKLL
jgi:hypothetical protein